MKFKTKALHYVSLVCGILALAIRTWLFSSAIDEKGLVISNHPANIVGYILIAAVPALLLVLALMPSPKLYYRHHKSFLALVGNIAGSAGIFYSAILDMLQRSGRLSIITGILGIAAGICLLAVAFARMKGTRPSYYLYAVVTIYLMLHILSRYQQWNIESQLQYYLPQLLAAAFLMLSAYFRAALAAGQKVTTSFLLCNQCALFFSCLAIGGETPLFYACMSLWALTANCLTQTDPESVS